MDWAGLTFVIVDGDTLEDSIVGSSDLVQNLDEIPTKRTNGNDIGYKHRKNDFGLTPLDFAR